MTDHTCPACGGQGSALGCLGFLAWFRCRDCGMDYSIRVEGGLAEEEERVPA